MELLGEENKIYSEAIIKEIIPEINYPEEVQFDFDDRPDQ